MNARRLSPALRLPTLGLLGLALLGLAPRPAGAQPPQSVPAPPERLTAAVKAAVVDTVAEQLIRFFAVADTGRLIAEHLRARLRAGAYDGITAPQAFMDAVTTDMKRVNGDKHLALVPRPPGPVMPMGAVRLPPLPATAAPPPNVPAPMLEMARHNGFGLGRVEILPGNVGYFQINGFSQAAAAAREPIVAALRYLASTDAIIFDVREHAGGSAYLSNFLISHFVGADSIPSLEVAVRAADQRVVRYTAADVPGPRRPDVPVYVLTSRGTVSAGEDFAFVMKNLGRATLVGETTAGAGRNNPTFDAGHGFAASISVSTVKDPKTGAEWEGVGVTPHVTVPPRTALAVAHAHALGALAASAPDEQRRRALERTREFVVAQAAARRVPAARLEPYVGVYGGERTITVEEGTLVFRRDSTRLGIELVPLSDSVFALGPQVRVSFERAGEGYRLRITPPAGQPLVLPRTGRPPRIASEWR